MAEKKIVVPDGMLKMARRAYPDPVFDPEGYFTRQIVEAALRWQSQYPPLPTEEQLRDVRRRPIGATWGDDESLRATLVEWMRHAYDAPQEPEVSENDICEIGAVLRDGGIRISNAEVGEILKASRERHSSSPGGYQPIKGTS